MGIEHNREAHARNGQSWVSEAKSLSDEVLIGRLKQCVAQDRRLTARLLEHFTEVERRGLFRDQGYASMFVYAVHALHMSEPEAGLRIGVARVCSKFPRALELLASGELHMSALKVLAPVLTPENQGLLEQARFKSKQEVLQLRARHFPQADEPTSIRRLPSRTTVEPGAQASSPHLELTHSPTVRPRFMALERWARRRCPRSPRSRLGRHSRRRPALPQVRDASFT